MMVTESENLEGIAIKGFFAALLCVVLIGCMYVVSPYRDSKQVHTVSAVLPVSMEVTDYVILRGTTVEQGRQNLYAGGPAVVTAVFTKPGDHVTKGQPLMTLTPLAAEEPSAGVLHEEVRSAIAQISPDAFTSAESAMNDELAAIVSSAVTGAAQRKKEQTPCQPYTLYSPSDGVVMQVSCTSGQEISGVFPCAAVSDLSKLAVKAQVSESAVSRIAEGMDCTVTVDALSGEDALSGQIQSILPYGRQTGTLVKSGGVKTDVWIRVSDPEHRLLPGYSAQAKVAVSRKAEALIVPYGCIAQDEARQQYVLAVQDGRAIQHYVETGYELEEGIEVTAGLERDQLLVCNPEALEHGDRVLATMEALQ